MTSTQSEQQTAKNTNISKQALGIAFAALFLWFAFKGSDPKQLWGYVSTIKPWFLVLVFLSSLASHLLRAVRWVILLKPLSDNKISLWNSFSATMIGYAVNIVIPRGGEIARLVAISRYEQLPWVGVLPTMFIDRLLDIALLVFLLGATLTILPSSITHSFPWLIPGGISLTVATAVSLLMLPQVATIINWLMSIGFVSQTLPQRFHEPFHKLANQFDNGTKCLRNPLNLPIIAALSVGIWFCYWLNFYLMIMAFGLEKQVNMLQCLTVFTIGSVGVLVPTPGSVGSFHFLVSQGLSMITGINSNLALAFATTLHAFTIVITSAVLAAFCVIVQFFISNKNNKQSITS